MYNCIGLRSAYFSAYFSAYWLINDWQIKDVTY